MPVPFPELIHNMLLSGLKIFSQNECALRYWASMLLKMNPYMYKKCMKRTQNKTKIVQCRLLIACLQVVMSRARHGKLWRLTLITILLFLLLNAIYFYFEKTGNETDSKTYQAIQEIIKRRGKLKTKWCMLTLVFGLCTLWYKEEFYLIS